MIQIPYNVERILLMAADMDTQKVKHIMTDFETLENGAKVPKDVLDEVHQVISGNKISCLNC